MSDERLRTISIVVPAYNAARWLEEALDSVLHTEVAARLEILVVDDGSTDATADMARARDPRVRVISQAKAGRSAARNTGMMVAKGDFVGFLDADDLYHADKLSAQLKYLDEHPDAVGVLTSLGRFGVTAVPPNDPWEDVQVRSFTAADFLVRDIGHPSSLLVRAAGLRDAHFPAGVHAVEDRIFLAMVRAHGPLGFIPSPLYLYRTHDRPHFSPEKLRWHRFESLQRWLRESPAAEGLVPSEVDALALRMLADELDADYFARQFDTFEEERGRLRQLWTLDEDHPVFHRRLWPGWMFKWKDALDGWRHSGPTSSERSA